MSLLDRSTPGHRTEDGLTGLSSSASGTPLPRVRDRFTGRMGALGARVSDRVWGWIGPLLVTLLAFGLQIWHLGTPDTFSFDETYYAKDAWSMLNNGYDRNYLSTVDGMKIDDAIVAGHTQHLWTSGPTMIVHPEVGKWVIALGEATFGMNSFGWRISSCVVGALMVLVLSRLARRLTGSTMLGCVAGLLLTFDGLHFVLSRLALLDIFLAFFMLCGVHCVIADRDWMRRRMAVRSARLADVDTGETSDATPGWGPVRGLLLRPWLLAGGVMFGLACGTKWDAIYPLAAFGVMSWLWSAGARRALRVRWSLVKAAVVDGLAAFVQLVVVAGLVYVASWTGWLIHADQYEANLSATQYTQFVKVGTPACTGDDPHKMVPNNITDPSKHWSTWHDEDAHGLDRVVDSFKSLIYYHHDVLVFHTHYLNCSYHPYGSKPSGWPLLNRPVGVATDLKVQPGQSGCTAPTGDVCYRETLLLGTPLLWWGGCAAMILAGIVWLGKRDWRSGVAVVGMLSTWLPWLQYDDRPIFSYYAIASLPFMILAIVLAMGRLIGPASGPSTRRTVGVVVGGSFFVLVLLNFAYFYPIYSYEVIPHTAWLDRMWFARWI